MTPLELHQRVIEFSIKRKERHLAICKPGDMTDTVPMIVLGKNDRYVGALAPGVDRDLALNMIYFGVQVLQPEVVVLAIEAFGAMAVAGTEEELEDLRKAAGESFEPGQFQREFEAGVPGRSEMLVVHTTSLDGFTAQWIKPYAVVAGEVIWSERTMEYDSTKPDSVQVSGFLPDSLADITSTPMPDSLEAGLAQLRKVDRQITARGLTVLGLETIYSAGCRSGTLEEVLPEL